MLSLFIQTVILLTGILGAILVARKNMLGFWSWMISNVLLFVISAQQGLWGMAALYVFYFGTCVYSLWYWRKDAPRESN